MTSIIAEVTNRSMGGNGVWEKINQMIPIGEQEKKVEFTPERINYLITTHNENMKRRREEAKRKKNG